jgi:hypothetical protein
LNNDKDPKRYIYLLVIYLNRYPKVKFNTRKEEEKEGENYKNKKENDEGKTNNNDNRKSKNKDKDSKKKRLNEIKITDNDYFKYVIYDLKYSSRITLTNHY